MIYLILKVVNRIGNVDEDILGIGKSTPSEVIRQLCGPTGSRCP
jgi:hypothetical protein